MKQNLFNRDVQNNPSGPQKWTIFSVDQKDLPITFQVKNYDDFLGDVLDKANALLTGSKVWVSPMSSYAVYQALGGDDVSNRTITRPFSQTLFWDITILNCKDGIDFWENYCNK